MITCKDLNFSYNHRPLIQSFSIDFGQEPITAVIGPNGSGKTTLLKILSGILQPEGGSITYSGHEKKIPPQDLFWLPTHIEMPFSYSVRDVLHMLLYPWKQLKRFNRKEDAVRAALAEVNLAETIDRPFNSLSAGEQHRSTLGAALVSDAKILILDEPCSNLDVGAAHRMMKKLKVTTANDKTIIFSIHDLQLAYQYCESFVLLTGKSYLHGSKTDIFASKALEQAFEVKTNLISFEGQKIPLFQDN